MRISLRFGFALLLVASLAGPAVAGSFTIADSDFSGGVYELRYYTSTNLLVTNGVVTAMDATPLDELFITNIGSSSNPAYYYRGSDSGVRYLMAGIPTFGLPRNLSAAATMGFDLSSVTGQIQKVEVRTRQNLAQFPPWNDEAFGDRVYADIATPTTFGTGSWANLYSWTGDNDPVGAGPNGYASNASFEVTSHLSSTWLNNPGLLEFRFGYTLIDQDIPGRHIQLFRDNSFWASGTPAEDSFLFRVTLAPTSAAVPLPSAAWAGLGLLGLIGAIRRRKGKAAA